jgi:poly(A) polymerase
METFGVGPGREVGIIKNTIKEAILEGEIHNDFNQAFQLMLRKGEELGLKRIKN